MPKKLLLCFCLIGILACGNVLAQEGAEDDLGGFESVSTQASDEGFDELGGFDTPSLPHAKEQSTLPQTKDIFSLSGDLAFKTSVGFIKHEVDGIEYSGVNQAQTSLYLQLDSKLSDKYKLKISGDMFYDAIYDIYSTNDYRDDITDAYKTQLRLDDTYIQGRLASKIDLKVGRQIVVWGKSDSIRVTDVINPLDNRLPGMTDIEDLRLSVAMAKLDYYLGMWNLSAMIIGESRIMLEAPPRSEFFPVDEVFPAAPDPFIELVAPESSLENMQFAFAANGVFSGWDLSFYAADVLDQKWHINPQTLKREVGKVKMLGSAVNIVQGSWLLKSEIALLDGVKYNSTTDAKSRFDALVGVDYMGITDTVLSLEVASRHIFEYEAQMSRLVSRPDYVDENELQTALRFTRSFSHDTINASALLTMFGGMWEYGGFARVWVEYDLADGLSANIGVVDYIDGERPIIKTNKDNDRIFTDITYSF